MEDITPMGAGSKPVDEGEHYRFEYSRPLSALERASGVVTVKLDPFRISKVYGDLPADQFTILKKVLIPGRRGRKSTVEDWDDIICAAERAKEMLLEDNS
ncbi:MAG: hypothetical protein GQ570_03600 [Helicobacteraceae bacterium]|nr:hypothetical protein [Helicobacteraceae bacterium]